MEVSLSYELKIHGSPHVAFKMTPQYTCILASFLNVWNQGKVLDIGSDKRTVCFP